MPPERNVSQDINRPNSALSNLSFSNSPMVLQNNYINSIVTPEILITDISEKYSATIPKCVSGIESDKMLVDKMENPYLIQLQSSLDLAISNAEKLYYNCDYIQCSKLTENILKQDPYHTACLPIYISCQVELKQSNSEYLKINRRTLQL